MSTEGEKDTFWGRCEPEAVTRAPFRFPAPHWRENDTCSHCGGLRPSLALEAIRAGARVVPTDKNYKIYLEGVPGRDWAKCYLNHFSESQAVEFVLLEKEGKMKLATPGHFYSGLCFGRYREAIEKALAEERKQ